MNNLPEYFANLEKKGIILSEAQKLWYAKKCEVMGGSMKKEFPSTPEEAFETNIDGLYFAPHMAIVRAQKRIGYLPPDPTLRIHTAWDLGFTDYTSILFVQIAGKEIHIVDYLETTGKSLAECIKLVFAKGYIYGTHLAPHDIKVHEYSSGESRLDTAHKLGLHFILAPDLPFADGIDKIRNTFPRIWFHNSGAVLDFISHIENYSQKWDRQTGRWSGRPDHNEHSHACFVGSTKISTIIGGKFIKDICIGDQVLTPNGYRKVLNKFSYKVKNTLKICSGSTFIECTENHKIFCAKGLVYADALRYNDQLYHFREREICHKKYGFKFSTQNIGFRENFLSQKTNCRLSTMDISTGGTENIIGLLARQEDLLARFIVPFGLSIMDLYRMGGMFTILMEIIKTMTYQIWHVLMQARILDFIIPKKKEKFQERQLDMRWNMLRNGIEAKKVWNGIEKMLEKIILEKIPFLKYAWNVERITLDPFIIKNSVQMHAKQEIGSNQESITLKKHASIAKKNLSQTDTCLPEYVEEIVALNYPDGIEVYDIEVEKDHCYYANDLLVSNSDSLRYLCVGLNLLQDEAQSITQQDADNLWKTYGRRI